MNGRTSKILLYVCFFLLGVKTVITGRANAAYAGLAEGMTVRVGGLIAILWSCWGGWSEWKKRKKQLSDSKSREKSAE